MFYYFNVSLKHYFSLLRFDCTPIAYNTVEYCGYHGCYQMFSLVCHSSNWKLKVLLKLILVLIFYLLQVIDLLISLLHALVTWLMFHCNTLRAQHCKLFCSFTLALGWLVHKTQLSWKQKLKYLSSDSLANKLIISDKNNWEKIKWPIHTVIIWLQAYSKTLLTLLLESINDRDEVQRDSNICLGTPEFVATPLLFLER